MVRTIGKAFGVAAAMMCLVSTLAIAEGQKMTCIKDTGSGTCTAARGEDGKVSVVVGNNAKTGAQMLCVDKGYVMSCTRA